MKHKQLWLWLSLALGAGNSEFVTLNEKFGGIENIYAADYDAYIANGISERLAQRLANKSLTRANEIYAYCKKYGVGLLCFDESAFPMSLPIATLAKLSTRFQTKPLRQ